MKDNIPKTSDVHGYVENTKVLEKTTTHLTESLKTMELKKKTFSNNVTYWMVLRNLLFKNSPSSRLFNLEYVEAARFMVSINSQVAGIDAVPEMNPYTAW